MFQRVRTSTSHKSLLKFFLMISRILPGTLQEWTLTILPLSPYQFIQLLTLSRATSKHYHHGNRCCLTISPGLCLKLRFFKFYSLSHFCLPLMGLQNRTLGLSLGLQVLPVEEEWYRILVTVWAKISTLSVQSLMLFFPSDYIASIWQYTSIVS